MRVLKSKYMDLLRIIFQRKPISYAYLNLKALHNFPGAPRPRAWVWAFEAAGGASGGAAEGEERGFGEKSW